MKKAPRAKIWADLDSAGVTNSMWTSCLSKSAIFEFFNFGVFPYGEVLPPKFCDSWVA